MKGYVLIIIISQFLAIFCSTCTEMKPKTDLDCLDIKLENTMCCSLTRSNNITSEITCEEHPISDSGKKSIKTIIWNGIQSRETMSCTISSEFCSSTVASEPSDCFVDKTVKGGQCCFDKKQNICFTKPYHYQDENFECNSILIKIKYFLFILLLILGL